MVLNSIAHKCCTQASRWKEYFEELKCEANRGANRKGLQNEQQKINIKKVETKKT